MQFFSLWLLWISSVNYHLDQSRLAKLIAARKSWREYQRPLDNLPAVFSNRCRRNHPLWMLNYPFRWSLSNLTSRLTLIKLWNYQAIGIQENRCVALTKSRVQGCIDLKTQGIFFEYRTSLPHNKCSQYRALGRHDGWFLDDQGLEHLETIRARCELSITMMLI